MMVDKLNYQIILFCILAYLISWGSKFLMSAQDTGYINSELPKGLLQLTAQFGPTIAGLIVIFLSNGARGISAIIKNLSFFKIRYKWYLFAIFFELIIFLIIVIVSESFGLVTIRPGLKTWLIPLGNFILNLISLSILTGLGEEIGWRGFLLPRLQSRLPVLISALILAFIVSFWHLRIIDITHLLNGNLHEFQASYFPDMGMRVLISIPAVFVILYLFNKTKGSLIIMILFHGASNASYEWVKETTGINDPSFILPYFALCLWLVSLFFIPALIRLGKKNEVVTTL